MIPLLRLLLAAAVALAPAGGAEARGPRPEPPASGLPARLLPPEVRQTIALIRRGGPFPHRRDGAIFQNRERKLPRQRRGYYREYTVPTPGARDRGGRRVVTGAGGELFYSDDHYRTFRRVEEEP